MQGSSIHFQIMYYRVRKLRSSSRSLHLPSLGTIRVFGSFAMPQVFSSEPATQRAIHFYWISWCLVQPSPPILISHPHRLRCLLPPCLQTGLLLPTRYMVLSLDIHRRESSRMAGRMV